EENAVGSTSVETVRVPLQVISSLFQLAEEITIALGSSQEQTQRILKQLNDVNAQDRRIQEQRFELETAVDVRAAAQRQRRVHQAQDTEFDSLEMDQYDEVYDLTHGLIEAVADARELNRDLSEQLRQLESLQLQQSRLNKELQRLVKHTRLVPAQALVPRLQRCIRHAARITGKLVQFDVQGIDTEINEDVLNKLADPLMHLLRNAVDHGIEPAQDRTAKNKSPQGYIELSFAQDGQHILIRCDDDGGGIDHARVRAKAVQRGLIGPNDALTDAQTVQLLMTPGFSTKDSINQVSGRGIGMDAVYKRVRELGGQLQMLPRQSGGTRCELKVPLQLVASHALLVQVQQQCFAIPTRQLNQILPPGGNTLTAVGEQPALAFDNQIYPAYSLGRLLGLCKENGSDADAPSQWPQRPVLLTQSAQEAAAIAVDAVLCNQDLVIKTTGDYVKNVPGIAGVAILGDGRLVPVLDLPALLERRQPLLARGFAAESGTDDYYANDARVLIVDDSLSVRKSLVQLVGDAGYRVETARDGLDAWEKIRQQPPALVLTDLEMPRLNGIELADRIRNNDTTQHIPVLMITSRSLPKHRGAAEKAGVTDYFTKPFAEGELLNRIHQFLAQGCSPI
ncbi:MAG TPA: response regulator, partial [Dongiaceae bacterium]|nr:response regulator [Dongiaceae bacterium]